MDTKEDISTEVVVYLYFTLVARFTELFEKAAPLVGGEASEDTTTEVTFLTFSV